MIENTLIFGVKFLKNFWNVLGAFKFFEDFHIEEEKSEVLQEKFFRTAKLEIWGIYKDLQRGSSTQFNSMGS